MITIGTDFEVPIIDKNNTPISAVGIVGGTKKEPLSIGNGCGRQEDNVAAEFTMPPSTDFDSFMGYIQYCLNEGTKIIKKFNSDYRFYITSSLRYPESELRSEKAMEFGCEESMCVHTFMPSFRPEPAEVGNLRTFGFHIHIGNIKEEYVEDVVRWMDVLVGIPSLILDTDTERRKIYGNAGDFRFKPYGLEYRSLGSGLLANQESIRFVWDQTQVAVEQALKGNEIPIDMNLVKDVIDNQITSEAEKIIEHFNIEVPTVKIPVYYG